MIIGMATSGVFVIANVLGMEMVGSKYRLFAGTVCHYFFTFGYFIVALVAYFLNKDWRLLQVNVVVTLSRGIFNTLAFHDRLLYLHLQPFL